jgi:hypothetical protein
VTTIISKSIDSCSHMEYCMLVVGRGKMNLQQLHSTDFPPIEHRIFNSKTIVFQTKCCFLNLLRRPSLPSCSLSERHNINIRCMQLSTASFKCVHGSRVANLGRNWHGRMVRTKMLTESTSTGSCHVRCTQ